MVPLEEPGPERRSVACAEQLTVLAPVDNHS